jgi:hypothetical protein
MITDKQNTFSDDQAVTANAASEDIIDLGAARNMAPGEPIELVIQLTADAGGTTPTLDVDVEQDDNESFSSAETIASAAQIAGGLAGDRASIRFWPRNNQRYVRLYYTVGGTNPDYQIWAGVVATRQESYD